MKHFNKIATACCSVTLGLLTLAGCEDEHFYEVTSPDWLSEKVDSIANSQTQDEEVELTGMMEDVYTVGNTDYSTGWWAAFTKYYVIPDGKVWNARFNLGINPDASNTYKNFALIISNDVDRGGEGYLEYGAIRYDHQPSGNSEWGDYITRDYVTSTLTFATDTDAGIESLGGRVTLTVDRTDPNAFSVTITNGTVTKTYKQPTALVNLNADESNTNIRCFMVPEGSYISFLETNIEPIGGCTSAEDKNPLSMELQNVPAIVNIGTPIEEVMANVTAFVTYEEGVTAIVPASELTFTVIPDMDTPGKKTLVAICNKTQQGANCDVPVMATATFEVEGNIVALEVVTQPAHTTYYYYTSAATETMTGRTFTFDPTGMEVRAMYASGESKAIANSRLTFSTVPAEVGTHTVTMSVDDVTATIEVTVAESAVSTVTNSVALVGAEDNSTAFGIAFTDEFNVPAGETKSISFTNYSNLANVWNNFVVFLRKANLEVYAVVRADNYGWGAGYDGNANIVLSGGQPEAWLASMNGAQVTVYVTNCGNGTADVQAIMNGTDGTTYFQYYLGISTIEPDDLNFALTVDGSHLVFE